jgi:membrane-bound lytic murein transglycosylase D
MHFAGMTLTIRDDARREIQNDVDALTRSAKYFNIKAERAKTYFPIVEEAFNQERLPVDFKYLALQESALVPDAVSSSNAVGFWQFKDFTAIEMGIRVDDEVDERMNIASASRAAARYIKQCNHYFNNWVYALQSYQMGAGGVMRAVGDKDLGTRHMEINSDTYWYVKKFLAHKVAFENVQGDPALKVTLVRDAGGKTIAQLSKEYELDESQIREFNKWLRTERIPEDREYAVLLPKGDATPGFGVLTVAAIPVKSASASIATPIPEFSEINGIRAIRARPDESLSALVIRGDVGLSRFLDYNEMDIDKPVQPGSWYFLGRKKKQAVQEAYTAARDEDLWAVSQRFGVRMKSLLKYNDLESEKADISGQTLYLSHHRPAGAPPAADSLAVALEAGDTFDWDVTLAPARNADPARFTEVVEPGVSSVNDRREAESITGKEQLHEVRPSDTLYSVARQYGVTIRDIMDWNGKKDFNLAVGEKLRVTAR